MAKTLSSKKKRIALLIGGAFVALIVGIIGFNKLTATTSAACANLPTSRGNESYSFTASTSGPYRVWVRMKTTDPAINSVLMQVDQSTCNTVVGGASLTANTWTWVDYYNGSTSSLLSVTLTAGAHNFYLAGNQNGLLIDRVILTQDTSCIPSGTGNNCADATQTQACPSGYTGTYPNCVAPSCPTGDTGTYPNCVAPTCPAGDTGTYPNCVAPSCPTGYTGTYPNCVAPSCPSGYTGTYPNCVAPTCPAGDTGTYPNCVAPTTYLAADINKDGHINLLDFSLLATNFGKTASAATNPRADINGDGVVNLLDFSLLASKYGSE